MATNQAFTEQSLSMILALSGSDPDMARAWEAYKLGRYDEATSYLMASAFYKNNNQTARQRKEAQINQPGAYQTQLESYKLASKKRLVATGVRINANDFNRMAETAFLNGYTDDQLDQAVLNSGKADVSGGDILGDVTQLKTFANSYGVVSLLNDNYWKSKSQQLFAGETTNEDIEKEIQNLSATAYPAYSENIYKGVSLVAQTSNVIQTLSTFLEKDADTISYDDPFLRQILQYVDPTTGKPTAMPQWLVEKTVKSHPDWAKTKNAQSTFDSLTMQVANDMFGGAI